MSGPFLGCLACGGKGMRWERVGTINAWGKPKMRLVECTECEPPTRDNYFARKCDNFGKTRAKTTQLPITFHYHS